MSTTSVSSRTASLASSLIPLLAVPILIVVATPLRETSWHWIPHIMTTGAIGLVILYFLTRNMAVFVFAKFRPDDSPSLARRFLIHAWIPAAIGGAGFVMGFARLTSMIGELMAGYSKDTILFFFMDLAWTTEITLLGLLGTSIGLALYSGLEERFQPLRIHLIALALTVIPCVVLAQYGMDGLRYVYGMILERGPMPYLIVYTVFLMATACVFMHFKTGCSDAQRRKFKLCVFFPVLFGLAGTLLGISSAASGFSEFARGAAEQAQVEEALGNVMLGFGIAFDPLWLGTAGSIVGAILYGVVLAVGEGTESETPGPE